MITDEAALLVELENLVKKYDATGEVLVAGSKKASPTSVQALQIVTFAIIVAPNNSELRDALVGFGMSKENEVELVGSSIDLQASVRMDILQVDAKIYYKGIKYDSK